MNSFLGFVGDLSHNSLNMGGLSSLGMGSDLSSMGNMGNSGGYGGSGQGLMGSNMGMLAGGKDNYGDSLGNMRDDRDRGDRGGRDRGDRDRRGGGGGGRDRDRDNRGRSGVEQGCQVFVRNVSLLSGGIYSYLLFYTVSFKKIFPSFVQILMK